MYKATFGEQKYASITVSMTTYVKLMCLIVINDIMPRLDAIDTFYNPQMVTSKSHIRSNRHDDARVESWHHSANWRQETIWKDSEIEQIGMPHTRVSQQPQQAIVSFWTGKTKKAYQLRKNTVFNKLHIGSPNNQHSNSDVHVVLLPRYNGNRQPIWLSGCRQSNKFPTLEGSRANLIKSYQQVKADKDAVYRDTHQEVNRVGY